MAIARHGTGVESTVRALASQVHPVFMLPPVATSLFGAILAPTVSPGPAVAHAVAIFFAVYTAHVKDGYVDFHRRDEDDDHPMTAAGCRLALLGAAVGFGLAVAALYALAGPGAALVTLPTWVVGYLHAPQLDTRPVTATAGYPAGIALCIVGGHYAQAGAFAPTPLAYAAVFLLVLCGVKVIDDATDHEYDRSIGKRTVAVAVGRRRAREVAHALFWAGGVAVLWGTVAGVFPASAPLAPLAFLPVAYVARDADPRIATMLLVRGVYVLLALLVLAEWFEPLAGAPLPDIGALGPYTYLATEVAFGGLALALLVRAGAVGRAARTVVVLYPLAYVWDWYTLSVGVFAIPLRTGVALFDIPIEEHLFMVVVPALVVGVHETLHG